VALGAAKHFWVVLAAASGALVALGLFFAKAGAFVFGSGLAIVPFLREGVIVQHHWLTSGQFLDAIAMGLITPGPVVITATFIGYLVGGLAGAVVATVAIFTPIYLGLVIPGHWFVRHRGNQQVKAFVRGATAAAAGAIAGALTVLARQAIPDWKTVLLAAAALALSLKWKVKEPYLVGLGAAAGILLHWAATRSDFWVLWDQADWGLPHAPALSPGAAPRTGNPSAGVSSPDPSRYGIGRIGVC
jgi:chromate transporter